MSLDVLALEFTDMQLKYSKEISAFLDFIFSSNSALFFAMFKHSSLGNPLYCFGIGISSK